MTTVRDPLDRVFGDKTAKTLNDAFGLQTAGDLLRHYPRRYVTRGELTELSSLQEGEHVTVLAKVAMAQRRPNGNRRGERLEVIVTDGTARLTLTYFHKVHYWQRSPQPERQGLFAGTVSTFRSRRQLIHPECEMLPDTDPAEVTAELAAEYATKLIAVYPASARMTSWQISKAVQTVVEHPRRRGGSAARGAPLALRPGRAGRSRPGYSPAAGHRRLPPGARPPQVGRGVRAAGRARSAPARRRRDAGHATPAGIRRAGRGVRHAAAVHPDQRPDRGRRDDLHRPGVRVPDAPPAAG